jgi:hypothetical protein
MRADYWAQWVQENLPQKYHYEKEDDDCLAEVPAREPYSCCSTGCMKCLDITYKDFM